MAVYHDGSFLLFGYNGLAKFNRNGRRLWTMRELVTTQSESMPQMAVLGKSVFSLQEDLPVQAEIRVKWKTEGQTVSMGPTPSGPWKMGTESKHLKKQSNKSRKNSLEVYCSLTKF